MADEENKFGEKVAVDLNSLPTTQLSKSGPFFKDPVIAVIVTAELIQKSKEQDDKFGGKFKAGYVRLHLSIKGEQGKIIEFEQDLSGLYFYPDKITYGKNSQFGQFTQNYSSMYKDYSDDLKVFLPAMSGKKVTLKTTEEDTMDKKGKYIRHNILNFLLN